MMRRLLTTLFASCLLLIVASVASGFNALGHSVIGKIAYDSLSIAQQQTIHEILKKHPHYEEYLTAEKPAGISDEMWCFLRATTWADWVRSNHRAEFHKSEWHYINYPYKMGQNVSTLPTPLAQPENILERLPLAITMVKNSGAANELGLLDTLTAEQRRAVALTWIFHLVGDAHQPLHMVAMINDPTWPVSIHGDQGGNGLAILISGTKPIRLHAYWDGVLGEKSTFDEIADVQESLNTDPPFNSDELITLADQLNFNAWGAEGYKLAAKYCYLDGMLHLSPWQMAYDQGADATADVPTLSATAQENAKKIYRQRLVLAGERMARLLNLLFP
jgi:S1/P1 Nuclease